jgi:hypothetical protein
MSGFAVDHVVIRTADRDGLVDQVRAATGLPALPGYARGGALLSRGVRFAGGPFLDVFASEAPSGWPRPRAGLRASCGRRTIRIRRPGPWPCSVAARVC